MKYYLAYGSNLDLDHMKTLCPEAKFIGITKIKGYRLAFRGEELRSYLTILDDNNSFIYAGVFHISNSCEKSLDYYEDYPNLYYKKEIEFNLMGKILKGLVYIMYEVNSFNRPSTRYINMVKRAYKYHKLDISLIENALNKK